MLSWSCGNLPVTVLLSSCGDRICVSVQVELINFLRAVHHKGPQLIDSDRNRVSASRSELHKNHPAKTVVFCRGGNKNEACAYKTIDLYAAVVTMLVYESKTHRSLWARLDRRAKSRQPAS